MECGLARESNPCSLLRLSPRHPLGPVGGRRPVGVRPRRVVAVEVVCQRCAGIDVSKRDAKVCVRVQGRGTRRTSEPAWIR